MALPLKTIARDPLFHFAVLAVLIFVADLLWAPAEQENIHVDATTIRFLEEQRADLLLRALTKEERAEIVNNYIEQEILLREAYARGLDRTSRFRTQLIRKMRLLLSTDVSDPGADELRAFYDAEIDRFTAPPAITFHHVLYADPGAVPGNLLEQLDGGVDHARFGDQGLALGPTLRHLPQKQIVSVFGAESARVILAIGDHRWHGPFQTSRGVHFLKVAERHASHRPSFEEMSPHLLTEWYVSRQREIVTDRVRELKKKYRIVVDDTRPDG